MAQSAVVHVVFPHAPSEHQTAAPDLASYNFLCAHKYSSELWRGTCIKTKIQTMLYLKKNNGNLLQLWSGSCRSGCRYQVLASPWSIWKFIMAFTQQSFISLFGISDREKTWIDIFPLHLESDQYNGIATWTICGESFEYVSTYETKIWSLPNWKKNLSNNENFKLMSLDEGKLREWDENTFHTPFKTSITWNREIAW